MASNESSDSEHAILFELVKALQTQKSDIIYKLYLIGRFYWDSSRVGTKIAEIAVQLTKYFESFPPKRNLN